MNPPICTVCGSLMRESPTNDWRWGCYQCAQAELLQIELKNAKKDRNIKENNKDILAACVSGINGAHVKRDRKKRQPLDNMIIEALKREAKVLKEEKDSLEYAYENVKFQRDDLQQQCDSLREQYNHMKDLRDNLQRDIDGWKRYVKDNEICPHVPWVSKEFHEKTVRALENKLEGAENLKKLNKIQGIMDE